MYWYLQQLTTDEAIIAWNDPGIRDLHNQNWGASNNFVTGIIFKTFLSITLANEIVRQAEGSSNTVIQVMRAEARFIRALSYWHALDLF